MTKSDKLRKRILYGKRNGIKFEDLVTFLRQSGFAQTKKKKGTSHRFFGHPDADDILNLQVGKNREAKPTQIDQIRNIFLRYDL